MPTLWRSFALLVTIALSLAATATRVLADDEPAQAAAADAAQEDDAAGGEAAADAAGNDDEDDERATEDKAEKRAVKKAKSKKVKKKDSGASRAAAAEESKTDVADKQDDDSKKDDADDNDEPEPVVTHHRAKIAGDEIAYTATAGKMLMKNDDGEAKANVFFVAYSRDKLKKSERRLRPITFCFNGGPGSSSVWLHMGMLGPKRVKLDSDAGTLPPPHEIIANEYSLLDVTDLVFIDPVSTGFSRPVKGEDKKQFHGYEEDLASVAQFIHDYTTKYGRWRSPKFLIGESYGGLRAAGLSGELQNRYHMYLNGIVLVSAVVDFQTLVTWGHNDLAYALFLPSYAATAWYHKALPAKMQEQSLEDVVAAAEKFAAGDYLAALTAGDSLAEDRRDEIVARMAELTGLSPEYIKRARLRVHMPRFGKELLRSRGRVVGRFDSRYVGIESDDAGESTEHDPSAAAVFGAFTSAMNDHLRRSLKVEEERVYEILTSKVQPWDYSEFTNRYVDATDSLRKAMTENPYLKVFAACGYYDLATPSFAMEYTRDHLGLAPELRDHLSMGFYEAGHMMYAHEPSLAKLRKDLVAFYETTLATKREPAVDAPKNDAADSDGE